MASFWLAFCLLAIASVKAQVSQTDQACVASSVASTLLGGTACITLNAAGQAVAYTINSNIPPTNIANLAVQSCTPVQTTMKDLLTALQAGGLIGPDYVKAVLVGSTLLQSADAVTLLQALVTAGGISTTVYASAMFSAALVPCAPLSSYDAVNRVLVNLDIVSNPGIFRGSVPATTISALRVNSLFGAVLFTGFVSRVSIPTSVQRSSNFMQFGPTYFRRFTPTGNRVLLSLYPAGYPRPTNVQSPRWTTPLKVVEIGKGVVSPLIKPGALVLAHMHVCLAQLINLNPQFTAGDNLLTYAAYCWVRESDVIGLFEEKTMGAQRSQPGTSFISQPQPTSKLFRTDSYSSWF